MKLYTLEQQRARTENMAFAEKSVKKSLRRHHIKGYIPGQVIYNLGEYPAKFDIRPTEYDYNLIKSLSEKGVGLIQIHEEWNDSMRILGADKFSSHDPQGLREFIDLCHSFGIKIIPYVSSGFFDSRDPDFTEKFATNGKYELNSSYYRYRMCDVASPHWDEYLFKGIKRILDEYEFDGLFNDMGYPVDYEKNFAGYLNYDPYLEDVLVRMYAEVKKRGGIMKIHEGKCLAPLTNERVYDYLWVGEGVSSCDNMFKTESFEPYVVPCPDFRFMDERSELEFYAKSLVFMQFVLRVDGRPVTGERADVPGVEYIYNPANDEKKHFDNVKKWYDSHPDGPHVYSEWSSIPDNPFTREKWFDYLALYKPMTTEDTIAYIDITESDITTEALPEGVHMSLFVNEEKYLCISNLSTKEQSIVFNHIWQDRENDLYSKKLILAPGEIRFLILNGRCGDV